MRNLSPRLQELVQRLWKTPDWLDRLFSDEDPRFGIVRSLSEAGDPAAIPCLAHLLYTESELASAAAQAITNLFTKCSSEDYVWLDEAVRKSFSWTERARQSLPSVAGPINVRATALGVASFHPNGRLRERAVKALVDEIDGAATPFLLIRLNDWAWPVREAARAALTSQLKNDRLDGFLEHLPLVVRLLVCTRNEHESFVRDVFRQLWRADRAALLGLFRDHACKNVRRAAYLQLLAISGAENALIIQSAVRGSDPIVRLWAVRDAIATLPFAELERTLDGATADPHPPVRREALAGFVTKLTSRAERELEKSLLDRSAAVREYARFHLRSFGWFDFSEFYRLSLATAGRTVALAGLAETGSIADLDVLRRYALAESASERVLAIRGIGRVSNEDAGVLLSALQDTSASVSREAMRAILQNSRGITVADLGRVMHRGCPKHARLAVVRLLDSLWSWSAIPLLLELSLDRDKRVAALALSRLTGRINRVFTSPTPSEQTEIAAALEQMEAAGASEFARDYRRWIRTRIS